MMNERLSPMFVNPRPITSYYPKAGIVDISKSQSKIPSELEDAVIRSMEVIETAYQNHDGHSEYMGQDLQHGIDILIEAIYHHYNVPMNTYT